jgi:hypothetical protein
MINDASDGIMNDKMGNTQITMGGMGGRRWWHNDADQCGEEQVGNGNDGLIDTVTNKSGLETADMQTFINTLTASNGTIQ